MQKRQITGLVVAIVAFAALAAPALAGGVNPLHRGAPGPLIGAGLPLLILMSGGYLAARRFRRGD
jgi:hypothetical protein